MADHQRCYTNNCIYNYNPNYKIAEMQIAICISAILQAPSCGCVSWGLVMYSLGLLSQIKRTNIELQLQITDKLSNSSIIVSHHTEKCCLGMYQRAGRISVHEER